MNKPIILAVNKIDEGMHASDIHDFYSLGLGEPMAISGAHGIGIGDLLNKIVSYVKEDEETLDEDVITFSLVGRPNVGKSSLVNAILNQDRVIVSDISGTTRDSIDTPLKERVLNIMSSILRDLKNAAKSMNLSTNSLQFAH